MKKPKGFDKWEDPRKIRWLRLSMADTVLRHFTKELAENLTRNNAILDRIMERKK